MQLLEDVKRIVNSYKGPLYRDKYPMISYEVPRFEESIDGNSQSYSLVILIRSPFPDKCDSVSEALVSDELSGMNILVRTIIRILIKRFGYSGERINYDRYTSPTTENREIIVRARVRLTASVNPICCEASMFRDLPKSLYEKLYRS